MSLDTDYAKSRVKAIRKLVAGPPEEREEDLTDRDRNILVEFDERLTRDRQKNGRCGWYHHANKLSDLFVYAQETGRLSDSLEDGAEGDRALDEIIAWLHEQDYGGYTMQAHLSTLRVFAETILGELPERFEEIEPSAHVEEDPAPLPSNIVEYPDAIEMVTQVDSTRDKALILVQWSAGMRPMGELFGLQRKNVKILDDHVEITLPTEDKTNRRSILVVVGSQLLTKWIEQDHPVHDDPEASMGPDTFIWTKKNQNVHLGYSGLATRFTVAGERAGLEKDHSPQHFRRSAASVLAGQPYISERDLRQRFSWSKNSDAPEHYIAANSKSTQVNVARCRGRNVEDIEESPDTAPILCPRCGDWTTRGLDACIWCSHNLDGEQVTFDRPMEHPDSAGEKNLSEMILDGDITAEDLRTLRKLEGPIKTERNLFDDLDELIVKAEALEEAQATGGDNVSSLFGVAGVVSYASVAASGVAQRWASAKHAAMKIHPGFKHYPPTGRRLAGVVVGWIALLSVAAALMIDNDVVQDAMAGEPIAVFGTIVTATLGIYLVHRDIPDVDEALDAATET